MTEDLAIEIDKYLKANPWLSKSDAYRNLLRKGIAVWQIKKEINK